jgi:hypothetical protein
MLTLGNAPSDPTTRARTKKSGIALTNSAETLDLQFVLSKFLWSLNDMVNISRFTANGVLPSDSPFHHTPRIGQNFPLSSEHQFQKVQARFVTQTPADEGRLSVKTVEKWAFPHRNGLYSDSVKMFRSGASRGPALDHPSDEQSQLFACQASRPNGRDDFAKYCRSCLQAQRSDSSGWHSLQRKSKKRLECSSRIQAI